MKTAAESSSDKYKYLLWLLPTFIYQNELFYGLLGRKKFRYDKFCLENLRLTSEYEIYFLVF